MRGAISVKIIVGLGNPGREYAATRHNVGFMVIDELARRLAAGEKRSRFRADIAEAFDQGEKIVLVKPQTYMNLSGVSVREATRWYKTTAEDVLVVADDIDLPFGTLRLRASGGSGGHNGLKSIFAELGSQDVARLKIGVGRGSGNATRQVLTRFNQEETRMLSEIVTAAADCVLDWRRNGVIEAMNHCNRRLDVAPPESDQNGPRSSEPESQPAPKSDPARSTASGAYNRARAWLSRRTDKSGGQLGEPR
jgi:PTH1 family peptidyl-tRNA hydrolase